MEGQRLADYTERDVARISTLKSNLIPVSFFSAPIPVVIQRFCLSASTTNVATVVGPCVPVAGGSLICLNT